jgi:hypothetical protein
MGHPWTSAVDDFHDVLLPKLKKIGMEIGEKARAGDELCRKIIGHYDMLARSFDPVTYMFLKEGVEQYMNLNKDKANERTEAK